MQFALVAQDHKDDGALARRLACRDAHIAGLRQLASEGKFLGGGAIIDEAGRMVGSNAHFAFADRAALDAWLQTEPYVTQRVWDVIEINEVRLLDLNA